MIAVLTAERALLYFFYGQSLSATQVAHYLVQNKSRVILTILFTFKINIYAHGNNSFNQAKLFRQSF